MRLALPIHAYLFYYGYFIGQFDEIIEPIVLARAGELSSHRCFGFSAFGEPLKVINLIFQEECWGSCG